MQRRDIHLLVLLGLAVIGVLAYRHGWHIPYYADDYQRMFAEPQKEIFRGFVKANFRDEFYRPLETMVLAAIQTIWGWDTFPLRIVNFFFHLCTASLVYYVLLTVGVKRRAAICGAVFAMLSQVAAGGVLGNDTQSQVTSGLFAAVSLWLLYDYLYRKQQQPKWLLAGSLLSYFLSLISKETSVGVSISIAFIIWSSLSTTDTFTKKARAFTVGILPFLGVFFVYWLLRLNAGAIAPTISTTGYTFGLGFNVLRNLLLFLGQTILPVSSFQLMQSVYERDYPTLALMGLFTLVFIAVVYRGLRVSRHKAMIKGVIVVTLCSWFPAIFLNHVGELYLYNTVPFVAALIGFSIEGYLATTATTPKYVLVSAASVYLLSLITNTIGIDDKAKSMKIEGDRATVFLSQLFALAPSVPHGAFMHLINPPGKQFEYSIFAIKHFRVSTYTRDIVQYMAHRPDIDVNVSDSADAYEYSKEHPGIAYTYDTVTMKIYPMTPNFTWHNKQ